MYKNLVNEALEYVDREWKFLSYHANHNFFLHEENFSSIYWRVREQSQKWPYNLACSKQRISPGIQNFHDLEKEYIQITIPILQNYYLPEGSHALKKIDIESCTEVLERSKEESSIFDSAFDTLKGMTFT
jgi:hypothetical protein